MESAAPGLLVVDDEAELRELLGEYFSPPGLARRGSGRRRRGARRRCRARPPALAILDVNMPGENGLSLARWIREDHPPIGVVMLTTAAETMDRIVGLEVGADDYVPKPFEMRELLARVRAVLRRAGDVRGRRGAAQRTARPPTRRRVAFGDRRLDLDERRLFGADRRGDRDHAPPSSTCWRCSRAIPNRPLNRDQIMEQAHNRGWDVFDRSIDLRVMRLRRKIETQPGQARSA